MLGLGWVPTLTAPLLNFTLPNLHLYLLLSYIAQDLGEITTKEYEKYTFQIHEEKTKKISTVKEIWICDPNYQKFGELFL